LADEKFAAPTNYGYSVKISDRRGQTPETKRTNYHQISEEWVMDIPENLPYNYVQFFNFLPMEERKQIDSTLASFDVVYMIELEDIVYSFVRFTINRILMIKAKECIYVDAFKKIDDNTWIQVCSSYDDLNFPRIKSHDRMNIVLGGLLYENDHEGRSGQEGGTKCTKFTLLDPATRIPLKIIKGMMGSYFKTFYREQARVLQKYSGCGEDHWRQVIGNKEF
jgi:hypothetical protein